MSCQKVATLLSVQVKKGKRVGMGREGDDVESENVFMHGQRKE